MSDLDELYQSVIIEHDRHPRNFRVLEGPHRQAEGYNPLCGDRVSVMVRVDGQRIADVSFTGTGCAISRASASLMTETLRGRTVEEATRLFDDFRELLTSNESSATTPEGLPTKLRVFRGVVKYPMRVKCATLPWHAMKEALAGDRTQKRGDTTQDAV
jgi:nitrogen fixation protein NifU and related proteins